MTCATPVRMGRPTSASDDLVARWSELHADAPFLINDDEVHCLRAIALNDASDEVACLLLRKLASARLLHPQRMPLDVVAIGATAEFSFGAGDVTRLRLVHPRGVRTSTDIGAETLVGAGLIGLAAGQAILWPDELGLLRHLRVFSVEYAAGALSAPARTGTRL